MKNIFKVGDVKTFSKTVKKEDLATFESGHVHPVYSTFSLARDAEWACRLFVLEMKEDDEEGIGTSIIVDHESPAVENDTVDFTATVKALNKNEIICTYEAKVGDRLIAKGQQGQKILKKEKIKNIFDSVR